ncbi:MAG TPA: Rieske (2Fe-2S) protein [Acidobacteriaceae bacterium]
MSGSVRLNLTGKLPKEGRFRPMRAGRRRFTVANQDGRFHVTDSLCPHKELPLGKGKLEGGAITCPWHGWCFDPVSGQQQKGRACLKTYPCVAEEDELFLILV